ncbi:hypothetical protein OUZ56_033876 [Daphnia magna]|uniref:Uncharacterized protein n=1 Tax=Daphnia magna TaxID=35525 RepID=A0ABQ9ZYC1_9CRUS|nr:hypothetical protein OUZ56_033876 [Daphnia magna]
MSGIKPDNKQRMQAYVAAVHFAISKSLLTGAPPIVLYPEPHATTLNPVWTPVALIPYPTYPTLYTPHPKIVIVLQGHPGLNWGHFDLQSNALPLSYTPLIKLDMKPCVDKLS